MYLGLVYADFNVLLNNNSGKLLMFFGRLFKRFNGTISKEF